MKSFEMDRDYFAQNADAVAIWLLGKELCHRQEDGRVVRLRILETEAYAKEDGTICYGNEGPKKGNKSEVLFSTGKLCDYCGMLLISCRAAKRPDNVLIRSGELLDGAGRLLCREDRPTLLRDAFWMGRQPCPADLTKEGSIWLEFSERPVSSHCSHLRINVPSEKKWRFCLQAEMPDSGGAAYGEESESSPLIANDKT